MKNEKHEVQISQKNEAKKEIQMNFTGTVKSYLFIKDPTAPMAAGQGRVNLGATGISNQTHSNPGGFLTTLLGTSEGQLYIMNKNFELRGPLETSPHKDLEILCMSQVVNGRGFVVAGNSRKLLMYEENGKDVKNPYVKAERSIQNKLFDNIFVNALCQPTEDYMVAGLKDGRLIKIKINTKESNGAEGFEFTNLVYPFHYGAINDIDVAVMKPLVVTCSSDKFVKIWNYQTKSLEMEKNFGEEAKLVAFHPSGFHLAVALSSRIKLLNVLMDGLEEMHDLIEKPCSAISYSSGGQYFAIAKHSTVHVYSSYTGENMANLMLKSEGNAILRIQWHIDDFRLYTLSTDGNGGHAVEWTYDLDKSERLVVNKSLVINNVALGTSMDFTMFNPKESNVENTMVATSTGKNIFTAKLKKDDLKAQERENNLDGKNLQEYVPELKPTGTKISFVKFNHNQSMLYMGTGSSGEGTSEQPGTLRAYKYPFTGALEELKIHSKDITKICVSRTDGTVFTIGEDGVFAIIRFKRDKEQLTGNTLPFVEEYLYRRDTYIDTLKEISIKAKTLKSENELSKRLQDEQISKQNRERNDFEQQKAEETARGEAEAQRIKREIRDIEEQYDEELQKLQEKHKREHNQMERDTDKRIESECQKLEDRVKAKEELERQHEVNKKQLLEAQQQEINEINREYEEIKERQYEEQRILKERLNEISRGHQIGIEHNEKEADTKMDLMRRGYEKQKTELEAEVDRQKSALERAMQECGDEDNANLKATETLNSLNKDIRDIQTSIAAEKVRRVDLEGDLKERENTIRQKNDRIKELERKSQELEKFKFVLKYKIGELRREIGPRDQEISIMKQQLEVMQSEIKEFKRTNEHLKLFVSEFGLQLVSIGNEIKGQEKTIEENKKYINAYECEISELCKCISKNEEKVNSIDTGSKEKTDQYIQ